MYVSLGAITNIAAIVVLAASAINICQGITSPTQGESRRLSQVYL